MRFVRRLVRQLNKQYIYIIPMIVLLGAIMMRYHDPQFLQVFRLKLFDLYNQLEPRPYVDAPVRIIDIDDESLARLGQWPWPRTRIADMLVRLFEGGARVVAFDIVFAENDRTAPSQALATWFDQPRLNLEDLAPEYRDFAISILQSVPDHDATLADIIGQIRGFSKQHGVVAGMVLLGDSTERKPKVTAGYAAAGDNPRPWLPTYHGAILNLSEIEENASGVGSFSLIPEPDGIIRRVPLLFAFQNDAMREEGVEPQIYPALSMEALRIFQGATTYIIKSSNASDSTAYGEENGLNTVRVGHKEIPVQKDGKFWVHFTEHVDERYVPAWKLFQDDFDASLIEGKILFIGTSAAGLKDLRATPLNPAAAGVEVHAQTAEQILLDHYLHNPDWFYAVDLAIVLVVGGIIIFAGSRFSALPGAFLAVATIAGLIGTSWYLYTGQRILMDPIYASAAVIAIFLSTTLLNYLRSEAQREQVRGAFAQYLSPALVEQLAKEPDRLKLGGELRNMTFLFCDVRGFTTISESFKSNPQGLTRLINRFLTPLTNEILLRQGTIDKYMGDCIMAFWNAPLEDPAHPEHACDSAIAMFEALDRLNEDLVAEAEAEGRQPLPLKIGIGINTGDCVVGNMGSEQRFDYSVLGDAVNLASRLEGQSKNYGVGIVLGEETNAVTEQDYATLELDLIAVKGKAEAVRIFALMGTKDKRESADFQSLHARHQEMLRAYRGQSWNEARVLIQECRQLDGELTELYDLYDERIDIYIDNPPGPDWDGVFVATSK